MCFTTPLALIQFYALRKRAVAKSSSESTPALTTIATPGDEQGPGGRDSCGSAPDVTCAGPDDLTGRGDKGRSCWPGPETTVLSSKGRRGALGHSVLGDADPFWTR